MKQQEVETSSLLYRLFVSDQTHHKGAAPHNNYIFSSFKQPRHHPTYHGHWYCHPSCPHFVTLIYGSDLHTQDSNPVSILPASCVKSLPPSCTRCHVKAELRGLAHFGLW